MITAICGNERNAGRTTVAVNLAAMLAQCGKDVLLIDTSENQSAMAQFASRKKWCRDTGYLCISARGELALTLAMERYAPRFGMVIVDTDAETARAAATQSDKCVIVTSPGWNSEVADRELIANASRESSKLDVLIVSNRCYPRCKLETRKLSIETEAVWSRIRTSKLSARWAFGYQNGMAATEYGSADRTAVKEATALYGALYRKFEPKSLQTRQVGKEWPRREVQVFTIDVKDTTPAPAADTADAVAIQTVSIKAPSTSQARSAVA